MGQQMSREQPSRGPLMLYHGADQPTGASKR